MDKINLTEENISEYKAKNYINFCTEINEYYSDLNKTKYIKRLFNRYMDNLELSPNEIRLTMNHIICFLNVFSNNTGVKILFFDFEKEYYKILKTFLVMLNRMPIEICYIRDEKIESKDIGIDREILNITED